MPLPCHVNCSNERNYSLHGYAEYVKVDRARREDSSVACFLSLRCRERRHDHVGNQVAVLRNEEYYRDHQPGGSAAGDAVQVGAGNASEVGLNHSYPFTPARKSVKKLYKLATYG